ncbi:MAG: alpha/beta fold hydrolase, partial [Gemmatimonadetes bacterium]|nr:alpha/beta fold hydrolase [Gemmatimonadota bacterium]
MTVPTSGVALQTIDRGTGPTVILIHGLGGRGADWTPQIDHLASRFRVVAPDLRGHGQSPKPAGPYAMRDLAADVAALIRRVGGGPVHVVGLSLGGMVAFQLAVDDPALVRTLTIVNSGPEVVPRNL